jgi:pyruvate dehydrogenase E2 component (dihydrolipoamide acetyltransferase)
MCYRFENDCLVPRGTDDVGLAIDLDGKLFVIPVAEPTTKTPEQISDQITTAVEQLRSGDSTAMKIRPASITITNLGGANVESFTPIINPPESAILGVGKIAAVPVVVNGAVAVESRATLTLAVDHRVVNGKYASEFLGAIVRQLESL